MAERASCPACGEQTLLINAVSLAVLTKTSPVAEWYGNPTYGYIDFNSVVECNRNACRWTGTVEEARSG